MSETLREGVERLVDQADLETDLVNSTPDPLTGRRSTMRAFVLTRDLRALLAATAPTPDDLAHRWHALSDHAADGVPFGGGLCNCVKQAERVRLVVGGSTPDEVGGK